MAYDIQQLVAAPRHVVLSSCDVGRTVVRPGEEILGFTAALLYTGTATVTASVTRVGDEAAVGTMTAYHRDRKSTRLNSSHMSISYAVFSLKKKNTKR